MTKNTPSQYIAETRQRLLSAKISIYKISRIIGEPESTLSKIFSGYATYSAERVNSIMLKVNDYLDKLERKELDPKVEIPSTDDCPEIFDHSELYTRLFEIGLNSNKFSPEEKLRFAIWHKVLKSFQEKQNPKEK